MRRRTPGPAIGPLWAAQQPGRLAVVTVPVTATVGEKVTAEVFEGLYNAMAPRGGTLVWLDHGDGAYEDSFWPAVYSDTYHVAVQRIGLSAALAMAASTPGQVITSTPTATATPSFSPTEAITATETITATPTVTATVPLSPTEAITSTPTVTATPSISPTSSATAIPTGTATATVTATATAQAALPFGPAQAITRYVIWDPAVPATINVASTIAAVDHVLAIDPADETAGLNVQGLGYHLFLDLRGRFHTRAEAYSWALANLAPATNPHVIAIQGVRDHGDDRPDMGARDYAVAARLFQFSVPPADPLYDRILAAFPPETLVLGFDPTDERTFTYKDSVRGDVGINTALSRNLSCHSAFQPPLTNRQPDPNPATVPIDPNKVYLAFTISDGDAVGLHARFYNNRPDDRYPGLWRDPARGSIPLGWGMSPVLAQIERGVLRQLYAERTPNDYFVSYLPAGYYNYHALPATVRPDVLAWNRTTMDDAGLHVGVTYDFDQSGQPVFTATEAASFVNSIDSLGWIQGVSDQTAYLDPEHYQAPLYEGRRPRPFLFSALDALADQSAWTEFQINAIADKVTQRPLFLPISFVIWRVRTLSDLVHIWQDLQRQRPGRYELVTPGQLMALQDQVLRHGGVRTYQPAYYPDTQVVGHLDGDGWAADAGDGPGLLSRGPSWTSLPPGHKVAAFRLQVGNNTADNAVLARLSVVDRAGNSTLGSLIVARHDFTAARTYQDFLVPFSLGPGPARVDLRVAVTGRAWVKLGRVLVHTAQIWSGTDPRLRHAVGRARPDGSGWEAGPPRDPVAGELSAVVATRAIPAGVHTAVWQLAIETNSGDDAVVASLAVYDEDTRTILAARDVTRQDFAFARRPQDFSLPFANSRGHRLDLRTYYWARAGITQRRVLVRD